jgi:tetratricopeptide (TPR) repeat protein
MDASTVTQARALYDQAFAAKSKGERSRALELIRTAIAVRPQGAYLHAEEADILTDVHEYWNNPELCQRHVHDGTLAAAVACWERAFQLGHDCDWSRFGMGHALTMLGRPGEGALHLRRAIDLKTMAEHPRLAAEYERAEVRGPDFLIVGATKCGTTSLYEYLCGHPRILPAIWKEPEYFRFPERGRDWYLSHFPRTPQQPVRYLTGEASSCYLSIWDAPELVQREFPDCKLIAVIRDPVDKAISHCHHDSKLGCEKRSVDEALNRELDLLEALDDPFHDAEQFWKTEAGYVWLGLYAPMIENWRARFSVEQMLVVPSEDLWERPERTLTHVFGFLGVEDHRLPKYDVHLPGHYDKTKPEPVRERLRAFYRRHNEKLFEVIGRRLDWQ